MKSNNITKKHECSSLISYLCTKAAFLFFLAFVMQNILTTISLQRIGYPRNETDRVALLAIKSQLVDQPNGVLTSWNDSIHHCEWKGVTCGHKHNQVNALDLNSRGLGGTISPFIGNLSFLREIYLYNNSLYGNIPEAIGNLHHLQKIQLSNNTLSGEIPTNISNCINLRDISLGGNKLEGEFPEGFGVLSQLQHLSVSLNNLKGSFFNVIQNLTSLVTIYAGYNSFTGTIPNNIGRMRNLTILMVAENKLSGTLPASLFNLSSLQVLDLLFNQLHGEVPVQMGLTTSRLRWLGLSGNKFSGAIPINIRNFTSLETIELAQNDFIGRAPLSFWHFSNLTILHLSNNHLMGDINFINTLVNCSQLKFLGLDRNDFSGILPQSIANLSTTLTWFAIGQCSISGTIPAGITNLINLETLYIVNTSKLTGNLPPDFWKLRKLEKVYLSSNRLTGNIPDVGNLTYLSELYLDDNTLEGNIPKGIGNCESLLYLNMENNHFNGKLPNELFGGAAKFNGIYLSQNHLEGSLPFGISKQINLIALEVSNNKLSGVIPNWLSDCPSLQHLYLDGNLFQGHIPPSLTSLASLVEIDVSRNHLSGHIPAYFSKFPLMYLNLSYNDFEGKVPTIGVFENVSGVFLDGNKKLCGGIQALQLPKCDEEKTVEWKKRSISNALKKVIIVTACAVFGLLATLLGLYLICRRKKGPPIPSPSLTGESFMKVSYDMLLKATAGFSAENFLGAGSFGSVFKGILGGNAIAVKVLNMQQCGASKSFIAECKALRNVRHRNLVGIITACSSIDFQRNDFRALVYELMPNGSLDKWLHGVVGKMNLAQRVDVAIDVAHAINYLHHECETPIVHCDLKPSNILLDNDMVARVGDFGVSQFLTQPRHPNQSSTIGIRGTMGYAAPEYGLGSKPSTEGDVYSYGILLLELITGKRPTDSMFKEDYNLHMYAEEALPDQVLQIVDPSLEEQEADNRKAIQGALKQREQCIVSVLSVGVSCSNHIPSNRMKISEAISRLQSARNSLLNGRNRRYPPARGTSEGIP